ncbi:dihydroorotate dehydrogenase [Candidatus Aquiluna sp. IMCC13023]|uniref:quinone-dependent dihydroorotate dehydrogenase n=1 Tax=Candidatus Aquiluna sp. IMCC13023 TaxID=1081644 RepID=UPI00025B156D|nr:quinone-dependent dihydroorotate dehydrogenase [Candidatus Aquiluna sp. IMCC13023]EIC91248.1 dihydroorotate dehydrogenase [Candidatus Aquiluna sp. IMCC13023]
MYRFFFKAFFTRLDPEFAHELVVTGLRLLSGLGLIRAGKARDDISTLGLHFENRLGMAAGFDKNGILIKALHALGFGHVEIGTVTPLPQPGNPKPRLFRLPKNQSLINRMGFNNEGAEAVAARIAKLRKDNQRLPIIGINIGKNKSTSQELAHRDYGVATKTLAPVADYLVVNVSSPNTAGLRDLQQVAELRPILRAVLAAAGNVPVLLKIAPDLIDADIEAIASLVVEMNLAGMVATNTTISRENLIAESNTAEPGGLSGPILAERSTEVLKLIRKLLPATMTVISVGGVLTKDDYSERLSLGADLVQGYTGFVYAGPLWAKRLTSR